MASKSPFFFVIYLCLLLLTAHCAERSDPEAPPEEGLPLLPRRNRSLSAECARIIMINYPFMDLKAALSQCCKDINEDHNRMKNGLFGAMNELLVASNPVLKHQLLTIPTIRGTKVKVSKLLRRSDPNQLVKMMRQSIGNSNNFIRGIDTSSNKPFLLFVVTSNIFSCYRQDEDCFQIELGVAVIFNETGIDHAITAAFVIQDDGPIDYTANFSLNVQDIAYFMKHSVLINDLGYQQITKWIHLRDKPSQHQASRSKRFIVGMTLYSLLLVSCFVGGLYIPLSRRDYGAVGILNGFIWALTIGVVLFIGAPRGQQEARSMMFGGILVLFVLAGYYLCRNSPIMSHLSAALLVFWVPSGFIVFMRGRP